MYTTPSTKRFLMSPDANSVTVHYLLFALEKGPAEGEEMLLDEIEFAIGEDKQFIFDAWVLLRQNNDEIYPHMRRDRDEA